MKGIFKCDFYLDANAVTTLITVQLLLRAMSQKHFFNQSILKLQFRIYVTYIVECDLQVTIRRKGPRNPFVYLWASTVQTSRWVIHSVSRHALVCHNCRFKKFSIVPIEQISRDVCNRAEILPKREMFWLYKLNTLVPLGLNEDVENVFIFTNTSCHF